MQSFQGVAAILPSAKYSHQRTGKTTVSKICRQQWAEGESW